MRCLEPYGEGIAERDQIAVPSCSFVFRASVLEANEAIEAGQLLACVERAIASFQRFIGSVFPFRLRGDHLRPSREVRDEPEPETACVSGRSHRGWCAIASTLLRLAELHCERRAAPLVRQPYRLRQTLET